MNEAEITRTTGVLMGRIGDMLRAGEISICQAADRALLIYGWAADRRETAGLVAELETVSDS